MGKGILLPTTIVGSYPQPDWLIDRAERLWIAPECGMKYHARDVAFGKLAAIVEGTRIVRRELGAEPV